MRERGARRSRLQPACSKDRTRQRRSGSGSKYAKHCPQGRREPAESEASAPATASRRSRSQSAKRTSQSRCETAGDNSASENAIRFKLGIRPEPFSLGFELQRTVQAGVAAFRAVYRRFPDPCENTHRFVDGHQFRELDGLAQPPWHQDDIIRALRLQSSSLAAIVCALVSPASCTSRPGNCQVRRASHASIRDDRPRGALHRAQKDFRDTMTKKHRNSDHVQKHTNTDQSDQNSCVSTWLPYSICASGR